MYIAPLPESGREAGENPQAKLRFRVFLGVMLALLAVLVTELWSLQVAHGEEYRRLADRNRLRLLSIDAPRGVIYDRQGRLLVRNEPTFEVALLPANIPADQEEAVLARLAVLLGMPFQAQGEGASPGLKEMLKEGRKQPQTPLAIKKDLPPQVALTIEEEHLDLPGVILRLRPRREYPYGPLLAHLLGYVGPIPQEQADHYLSQKGENYEQNDLVGLMGLELTFEDELRGGKGRKLVEVDANERELRVLGEEPPSPGHSLILTLDVDLQQATEKALSQGMRKARSQVGVAIAMDPRNGEVLAMVSLPSYDDNLFAQGIEPAEYQALTSDPRRPLFNHAIGGQYPPGSTIKPLLASAALEEGVINASTHLACEGTMLVPNQYFPTRLDLAQPFYCWNRGGHGKIDLIEALVQSCDIFFYRVGGGFESFQGLGLSRLTHYYRLFGLGEKTGIALPGEARGLVPSDQWKKLNYGEGWVLGDTYNISIGQGFLLVTPLQLLNATAAIANGGTLYKPYLVRQALNAEGQVVREFAPEAIRKLPISPQYLKLVRQGMRAVVSRGMAQRANLEGFPAGGKTGTAEYPGPRDAKGQLPTHAWFTTFAPEKDPEVAVVVFLAGGGQGWEMAVPVAAEILQAYFQLIHPQRVGR